MIHERFFGIFKAIRVRTPLIWDTVKTSYPTLDDNAVTMYMYLLAALSDRDFSDEVYLDFTDFATRLECTHQDMQVGLQDCETAGLITIVTMLTESATVRLTVADSLAAFDTGS